MKLPPASFYLIRRRRVAVNLTYMGALSWLNAETLERAPIPLFGRIVRCFFVGLNALGRGSYILRMY